MPRKRIQLALALLVLTTCVAWLRADYPIVSQRYLADPGALVYHGRVYLYCSNDDENPVEGGYVMKSIVCVSSSDLKNWTDHGVVFRVPADAAWAGNAWAPAAVARNGQIYLYFGNNASGIGVASSVSPTGPFIDAKGGYLINASTPGATGPSSWLFDPAVFVDDDGQAYLYFGGNGINNARVIKLNPDMISTSGAAVAIPTPNFFEASWMHKRNGVYYFSYSANPSSGLTIDYLTSSNPMTGFTYAGIVAGQPPSNNNNNHHAIFSLNGAWYHAYHNRAVATAAGIPTTYRRNLGLEMLSYNPDGTLQRIAYTTDGVAQLGTVNPFIRQEAEMMNAQSGITTEPGADGGMDVRFGQDGAWTRVRGVDFGPSGPTGIKLKVAAPADGGSIEIRLGSVTGTVVSTCTVPSTGGVQTWTILAGSITGVTGVQDVYLKFKGASTAQVGLDWWQFTGSTTPANLVGFRAHIGEALQFSVTGSSAGDIWGTDVYSDDSSLSAAAVHAGVLRAGETATVTVVPLPGQTSYSGSSRNGVTSSDSAATTGSFAFAGAGVAGTLVETAPMALPGFSSIRPALATGDRFVCPILVGGGGPYAWQWYRDGMVIAGATTNPLVLPAVTPTDAGTYSADVSNALGTRRIIAGTLMVGATGAPRILTDLSDKAVYPGSPLSLTVETTGTENSYRWVKDGVALAGQTQSTLWIAPAMAADAGSYAATITNAAGSVTTRSAKVEVSTGASRLINMSCRIQLDAGRMISPGFYIDGTGTKQVLIRAAGPALVGFGLDNAMPDPQLHLFHGKTEIAANDNWDATTIGAAFRKSGAFDFAAGSRDAALLATLAAGESYTVQVSGVGPSSGIVLLEVYDADDTGTTSKLTNVSVRGVTGTDAAKLVLGFVLSGTGRRTLLIRGAGPALLPFGVTDALADPQLQIYDPNGRLQLTNNGWTTDGLASALTVVGNSVGAFPFAAKSADAATLAILGPSNYTVHVTSVAGTTGEALAEVYEAP